MKRSYAPALAAGIGAVAGLRTLTAPAVLAWAARTQRTVEITMDGDTLKLDAATPQQQQEIIDAWLARHGTRA